MADEITVEKSFWTRTRDYFGDVRAEMKKVNWPGRQEIYGTTMMVIATTFLFAFYFYICDWTFQQLVGRVLGWFGRRG